MAEQVSIWRWAILEELEPLFARLIAADDAGFALIAQEVSLGDAPDDPEDVFAQAEAKVRAMGLTDAELATTLAGLKAMQEEALAERAAADDFAPDPEGQVRVSLASSHLFYDDPFASLPYEEIAGQVAAAMDAYRAAISAVVGHQGQSMAAYLGLDAARMYEDAAFDVLLECGLAEADWVWSVEDHVVFLSQWQEDKELPIDLEFGRAPKVVFEAARVQVAATHEM